jgi:hypothetical protein
MALGGNPAAGLKCLILQEFYGRPASRSGPDLNASKSRGKLRQLAGSLRLHSGVNVLCFSSWFGTKRGVLNWIAPLVLAACLPNSTSAMISASLTWTASSDPTVVGYNIYFGGGCQQYTNFVAVGAVSNAVVSNLEEGVPYFFAAKACNAAGQESPFSNEAIFCGVTATPGMLVQQAVLLTNLTGDQLTFSLATNAPAGAGIDPTNGVFTWCPGLDCASTTNAVTVLITDNSNPSLSTSETLLVVVTDYLVVGLGSTVVQTGQSGVLPITLAASDSITNLQMTFAWPASQFATPTLTFAAPVVAGSVQVQNSTAVVQLQIAPGQSLAAGSPIAQLNFQALAGQSSAFVNIPGGAASGSKSDGSSYLNVSTQPGEVVVVGSNPLLQSQTSGGQGRTLTLFGNPGANYQVQYATNLVPPVVWLPLVNHQQGNLNESIDLDNSQPMVYYRLQQF